MPKYILAHEEHETSPLTISPNHNAWPSRILKDLLDGKEVGEKTFCIHENNGLWYYPDYKAWDEGSDYLIKKLKNNPDFVKHVYDENVRIANECMGLTREFERVNLDEWTNREIVEFLQKSYKLANDFSAYGFVPVFSDHLFHKFTHLLKNIIKDSLKKGINLSLSEAEILHLLSSPLEPLPSRLAQIELIKLALEDVTDEKLEKYYHDWFWIGYGQLGPRQKLEEVKQDFENLKINKENTKKELDELLNYFNELKKEQEEVFEELSLSEKDKYIFKVAQEFMYLKGLRMEVLFGIYASWGRILDKMSKEYNLDKKLFYYASIQELSDWLKEGKIISEEILKERQKYCVWVALSENNQEILSGEEAKKFVESQEYRKDEELEDVLVIHGTVASLGFAKGKVKIVNKTEEIGKVEEGDVLVSVATHPGLVPAMKKAAGFVTDSGGITSHAAIVAREMKKPCIIGTKIATKVLKDGDLVELNTKDGDVHKI